MLTAARQREMLASMNAAARTVFEHVPALEPAAVSQIVTLLARAGKRYDQPVCLGCLGALSDAGLVRSFDNGRTFMRVAVKPAPIKEKPVATSPEPAGTTSPPTPLERFGALSAGLRQQAQQLLVAADLIDSLGLEAEDRVSAASRGGERMAALRKLLLDDMN